MKFAAGVGEVFIAALPLWLHPTRLAFSLRSL